MVAKGVENGWNTPSGADAGTLWKGLWGWPLSRDLHATLMQRGSAKDRANMDDTDAGIARATSPPDF